MCNARFIAVFFLFLIFSNGYGANDRLALPASDIQAPVIEHQPISGALKAGESVRLRARVTDNGKVKSVVLFYRTKGTEQYKRENMQRSGQDANIYEVELGAGHAHEPGLEYYIQAEDEAGNILLQGHSFSPLIVRIGNAVQKDISETSGSKKQSLVKNKWLWIGVGVAAAIAAGSSGGGGGNPKTPACPAGTGSCGTVTINW